MARITYPRRSKRLLPARVTVVVPCYNYGRYLPDSVGSVLSQDGVDVDVIIVDDASPDGSGDVAEQMAARDRRISLVRHEQNAGHIATYNDGLARVAGEFVVLLSADDLLTPGSLRRATDLFDSYPSVGLVYGRCQDFTADHPPQPSAFMHSWTVWSGHEWLTKRYRRGFNIITSPEVVLRRTTQAAIGPYSSALPHTADLEMWLRAAFVSDVARVNGSVQACRRLHGSNMSRVRYGQLAADIDERLAAFSAALADASGRERSSLERSVHRALAREALEVAVLGYREGPDADDVRSLRRVASELWPESTRLVPARELQSLERTDLKARLRRPVLATRRSIRWRSKWYWRRLAGA